MECKENQQLRLWVAMTKTSSEAIDPDFIPWNIVRVVL
jgi:hypothetical protein